MLLRGKCTEFNLPPPPPHGGCLVLLRLSVFSKIICEDKKCLALGWLKSGGRSIVVFSGAPVVAQRAVEHTPHSQEASGFEARLFSSYTFSYFTQTAECP